MSDRIVVMNAGQIEQIGTPEEIYEHPRTAFVADFIGVSNLIDGSATPAGAAGADFLLGDQLRVRVAVNGVDPASASKLLIRPEKVRISRNPESAAGHNVLPCRVDNLVYMGSIIRYYLDVGGHPLICDQTNIGGPELAIGDNGYVSWAPHDAVLLVA